MPSKKTSLKAPKPENLEIIVRYTADGGALSEDQKTKLIKNLKKENYYHKYLTGVFRFSFKDSDGFSTATYLWKGGAGDTYEAGERVLDMLTGEYYETLPEGVKAKLVSTKDVSYRRIII